MVRTEAGRVVYARKKHVFEQSDLDRILTTLDEAAANMTVWEAVQATFRKVWSYRKWTVREALEFYTTAFEELDDYLGMLDEALMLVLMKSVPSGRGYTPTVSGFHQAVARKARHWAYMIEGKE